MCLHNQTSNLSKTVLEQLQLPTRDNVIVSRVYVIIVNITLQCCFGAIDQLSSLNKGLNKVIYLFDEVKARTKRTRIRRKEDSEQHAAFDLPPRLLVHLLALCLHKCLPLLEPHCHLEWRVLVEQHPIWEKWYEPSLPLARGPVFPTLFERACLERRLNLQGAICP